RVGDKARIVLRAETLQLAAALAEIVGLFGDHPAPRHVPLGARLGLGPGGEDARRRGLVATFQPDRTVLRRAGRHCVSRNLASWSNRPTEPCSRLPASSWPSRNTACSV